MAPSARPDPISPAAATPDPADPVPRRGAAFAGLVADARNMCIPPDILDAAKRALVDHVGVAIGGLGEPAARGARAVAESWRAPGTARIFLGPQTNAALAAFVNATAAHCLDFDDTHAAGAGHISAPVWATALALAADRGLDEAAALRGFLAGYEVMARLGHGGTRGIGKALQERGLHPTGINGTVGAAAAAAAMAGQDAQTAAHALALAGTSAAGLVTSFGTDAKPYHAGRAAWNGILAADLAGQGLTASASVFEVGDGLLRACVQDGAVTVPPLRLDAWEIARNGYKPYACCRAAHASILAAQRLAGAGEGRPVARIRAQVHWSAQFTAGNPDPQTPLEAKFSVAYCIAAALCGHAMAIADFEPPVLWSPAIRRLLPLIEIVPVRDQPQAEARLDVWFEGGGHALAETTHFLGHPDNPMSPAQEEAKFLSLVEPALGAVRAGRLLAALRGFDSPGALLELSELLAPSGVGMGDA